MVHKCQHVVIVKDDDGPFYTHLGAASSEKELREVLEER